MLSGEERERLRDIRERADRATPGPWHLKVKGNTVRSLAIPGVCCGISPKTGNGEFIAQSRADVPWLLALVERLASEAREF